MSTLDREAGRNGVWLTERGCEVGTTGISWIAREKCAKLAHARHFVGQLGAAGYFDNEGSGEARRLAAASGLYAEAVEISHRRAFSLQPWKTTHADALLRMALADREFNELREHGDVIVEGSGHSGRSALIDLVANRAARGR